MCMHLQRSTMDLLFRKGVALTSLPTFSRWTIVIHSPLSVSKAEAIKIVAEIPIEEHAFESSCRLALL